MFYILNILDEKNEKNKNRRKFYKYNEENLKKLFINKLKSKFWINIFLIKKQYENVLY